MNTASSYHYSRRWLGFQLVLLGLCLPNCSPLNQAEAAEPFAKFMASLKNEQMFDLAARYLEYAQEHNLLPEEVKKNIDFERLDLRQQTLTTINSPQKRDEQTEQLKQGYEEFLRTNTNDPRRGEARIKLADLTLQQGVKADLAADNESNAAEKEKLLQTARDAFKKSEEFFTAGVNELAEQLKAMAGANIDPSDTAAVDRRREMQLGYRTSQIMIGSARQKLAETYPDDSADFKKYMQKAQEQFNDVSTKASRTAEAGTYYLSVFYRGQAQAALKEVDPAIESLLRVSDQNESALRWVRVQATSELVRLLSSPESGKYEAAIQRGEALMQQQQSMEKDSLDWQDLQIAIAEAKLAWSKELAKDKKMDSQVRKLTGDTRDELQKMSRLKSPAGEKARRMLSDMGVDVAIPETTKLPRVRNFSEAFIAANERIETINRNKLTLEILESQIKGADSTKTSELTSQIEQLKSSDTNSEGQAIELFHKALELFDPSSDSREDLATARFRLAYMLYSIQDFYGSAAIGDLTARVNRGTDVGLTAAQVAIYSYQQLLSAIPEGQEKPISSLERFAEFMLETWPDAEASSMAANSLLRFALAEKRWSDAEETLKFLPPAKANAVRRDIGFVLYNDYLRALLQARQNEQPIDAPEIVEVRNQAEALLAEGFKSLDVELLDERAVQAADALASIYLRTDRPKQAEEVLDTADFGPLAAIERDGFEVSPATKMETLRLALQSEVNKATNGGGALNAEKIQKLVAQMQVVAATDAADSNLLTNALIVLANDLRLQLADVKSPAEKMKLGNSIRVLLSQLISVSQDTATLEGASRTLAQLADGVKDDRSVDGLSKDLNSAAVKGFEKLLEIAEKDPQKLTQMKRSVGDLQAQLAAAYSHSGMYEQAAELYTKVLRENGMMLLAQVNAAENYQEWAAGTSVENLRYAMFGAQPDAKRKNIIWGWGRLSQLTANRKDLEPYFFDARLNLAICRAALARLEPDADKKTKALQQALGDIRTTYIQYPELGDPATTKKFDNLTRTLQRDLQTEQVGLKEFD